jgi:hypothetical protein
VPQLRQQQLALLIIPECSGCADAGCGAAPLVLFGIGLHQLQLADQVQLAHGPMQTVRASCRRPVVSLGG